MIYILIFQIQIICVYLCRHQRYRCKSAVFWQNKQNMFTKEEKQALRARLKRGDRKKAEDMYRQLTGKPIHRCEIDHFLSGRRSHTGGGTHRAEDLYQAVLLTVEAREVYERNYQALVKSILNQQAEIARSSMSI